MIQILESQPQGDVFCIRLGCTCGEPRLAAYPCGGDQLIFCSNCGEMTSRDRLRNVASTPLHNRSWRWTNVTDHTECPLVNVSIPVRVQFGASGRPTTGEMMPAIVTKMSMDKCFLRLEQRPDDTRNAPRPRSGSTVHISGDDIPFEGILAGRLEDVIRPYGDTGPVYHKIELNQVTPDQRARLADYYQSCCGLNFNWRVLLYSDQEHIRNLRQHVVECLPRARVEAVVNGADFSRHFRNESYDLVLLPPLPEMIQMVTLSNRSDRPSRPYIIILLRDPSQTDMANALRWGGDEVLSADCTVEDMRRVLQFCTKDCPIPVDAPAEQGATKMQQLDLLCLGPQAGELVKVNEEDPIRLLLMASETHDSNSSNHLKRISAYCAAIARELGWPNERIAQLAIAAKLHDIGKIGVPDEVLHKTGALTSEERETMQQHTRFGYHILQGGTSRIVRLGALIALRHHERYDGRGYPDGLHNEAIPVEAQVVSVADVFDALTSARPYKPAWSNERAIQHIKEQSGMMFNPTIVQAFLKTLREISEIQLAFLDDFRDIWTERRQHHRFLIGPVPLKLEMVMPEQTFHPYGLQGEIINISEGGIKVRVQNVSNDLFSSLVSSRRYAKLFCDEDKWTDLNQISCEVSWMDYYTVPDPNACDMGLAFKKNRAQLVGILQQLTETIIQQARETQFPFGPRAVVRQ